jgi:hypothetical protein
VTGVSSPYGLSINGNDLYITNYNGTEISKIDITAPLPTPTVVVTGLSGPYGLSLNGNELYIAEFAGGKISKVDITVPTPTTPINVVTGLNQPIELLFVGNTIYFTEFSGSKISKIDNLLSSNDVDKVSFVKIYPNPSSDFIQVSGIIEEEKYKIFDIIGKEISNGIISNNKAVNIQNLTKGIYLLKFDNGNTIKFIKK